jgi:hypothetical protein
MYNVILQAWTRVYLARSKYSRLRLSVTHLQRRFRSRRNARATTIQTSWRGKHARMGAARQKAACTVVQTRVRGWLARRSFLILRAVIRLQALVRRRRRRRAYLQVLRLIRNAQLRFRRRQAVTRIQACVRGRAAWRAFQSCRAAVVALQSIVRGARVRTTRYRAARRMQSRGRAMVKRRVYLRLRTAVIVLQRIFRRLRHARAVVVQREYRAWKCRFRYSKGRRGMILLQVRNGTFVPPTD